MSTTPDVTSDANATREAAPIVPDMWSGQYGDSLTGFDELAITKAFGANLDDLAASGGLASVRALVFVHRRREGDSDKEAKAYALEATRREVADYFAGLGMPAMESEATRGEE